MCVVFSPSLSLCSAGKVQHPSGLAVDPSTGLLYIAGWGSHRIAVINPATSAVVRTIGSGRGSGPGQLQYPSGIALDAHGNLLVADTDNQRISVFRTADGAPVAQITTPMRYPRFVFVHSSGTVLASGHGGATNSQVCAW